MQEYPTDIQTPRFSDITDMNTGCTLDGFAASCDMVMRMMDNGAAQQCPNNYCGPITIRVNGQWVIGNLRSDPNTGQLGYSYWNNQYSSRTNAPDRHDGDEEIVSVANQGRYEFRAAPSSSMLPQGRTPQRGTTPRSAASLAPNGLASDRKLTDEECDAKLARIFGGDNAVAYAMVNSDIRGEGRGSSGHSAAARNDMPLNYTDSKGNSYKNTVFRTKKDNQTIRQPLAGQMISINSQLSC